MRDQRIKRLQQEIAQRQAELDVLTTVPDEPETGAVIQYTRTFGGKPYTYAAVRVGSQWYTTAQTNSVMTWTEIVDRAKPGSIVQASKWAPLVEPRCGDDVACSRCGRFTGDVHSVVEPWVQAATGTRKYVNLCAHCLTIREAAADVMLDAISRS